MRRVWTKPHIPSFINATLRILERNSDCRRTGDVKSGPEETSAVLRLLAIHPRRVDNTLRTRSLTQGTGFSVRSRTGWLRSSKKQAVNGACPTDMSWGRRAGGAWVAGLRYGDGMLYTKNAGDRRVYWQGPSLGFDFCGDGARTMMLVYDLPVTDAIYQRFVGIEGSAYFVGGLGMTALSFNNIVVVPVRSGVGLRLGANVGYLKFTPTSTWNPF